MVNESSTICGQFVHNLSNCSRFEDHVVASFRKWTTGKLGPNNGKSLHKFRRSTLPGLGDAIVNREKPLKSLEKLSMKYTKCYERIGPAISVSAAEKCRIWV